MVTNSSYGLSIYYSDDLRRNIPLMPFLVAPVAHFQDTLIVGPQSIAALHDQFINSLYSQIGDVKLQGIVARAFVFDSKLCIAVILPTSLSDEGGRTGLTLSIGFFVRDREFRLCSSTLSLYMDIYLKSLNRIFSLTLPSEGADELLQLIQSEQGTGTQQRARLGLHTVLDSLLLSSIAAGEISSSISSRLKLPRWYFRRKRKLPKAIFYPAGASQQEVLGIFLSELGQGVSRAGITGVQELFEREQQSFELTPIMPFSNLLADARKVKLKKSNGKSYLTIY
jgi:hypothetical protein